MTPEEALQEFADQLREAPDFQDFARSLADIAGIPEDEEHTMKIRVASCTLSFIVDGPEAAVKVVIDPK